MDSPKSSRREFCTHALTFVTATSLLESCGGSPTSPSSVAATMPIVNATVTNNAVVVNVDTVAALASVGGAALVQSSRGDFLVARVAQDTFNAMTAVCTHEACTVTRFGSGKFQCPCHGSEYDTNGGVTKGPAPSSLRRFTTQFAGNVLTISL